jgi:glycosyltransferase involved in cell wall biosynthesis
MGGKLITGRGGENVLFNLISFKPSDIEVEIIEPDFILGPPRLTNNEVKKLTENGKIVKIKKHYYKTEKVVLNLLINFFLNSFKKDYKWSQRHGFLEEIRNTDVAYLFENGYSIFFKGMKIPVIGTSHNFDFFRGIQKKTIKNEIIKNISLKKYYFLYFRYINGFHVFVDKKEFKQLDLKYKMILPNGINVKTFYPDYNIKNKNVKFLFVGLLHPNKGLDILLPVIDRINDSRAEFHIVGVGDLEEKIKKHKSVIYHGLVDNDSLSKIYRECDVFIYPSHADTYSLVVLEALSSGLYVLTGEYLRGNFDDFEGKYLEYLPMDVESFYNRVTEIINNRKIIEHNKKFEYEYVKEHYDWRVIANKFYEFIRKFYEESQKG